MHNRITALAALAATSLGAVAVSQRNHIAASVGGDPEPNSPYRIYGYENIRRHILRTRRPYRITDFDPRINRHTARPHEHRMERARRLTRPGTIERKAMEQGFDL